MRPYDELGLEVDSAEDRNRYLTGRDGDNLMTPFQCDLCHFRNLMNRDPISNYAPDVRLLKCIRRANLDAFWAREPSTVKRNLEDARRGLAIANSLGFGHKLFRPMGPFPLDDTFGMGAAIVMLQRSLEKGRYGNNIQFSTMRKFRSVVSNIYHASAEGQGAMVMAKDTRKLTVTECPTYGDWFERFVRGVHKRMGDIVRSDRAISSEVLQIIMDEIDSEWIGASEDQRFRLALEGAFYLIAFTAALRGEEIPLVDLYGVKTHWDDSGRHVKPHVVIALLGRFKGETGENYHLMPVAAITRSGLEPRKWIGRVLEQYESRGIVRGPFFRNRFNQRIKASDMEPKLMERLEFVQERAPHLIGSSVQVDDEYGVYRSFRRGATSEAVNQGVPADVIESNNRWRRMNQAGGRRPGLTMREHYTDVRLAINHLLRFSEVL